VKAFLMYRNRDFDPQQPLPPNAEALRQDLELDTLFEAMTQEDAFLSKIVKKAVLSSENDLDVIRYRQHVLKDCLHKPEVVREIYDITVQSHDNKKKHWLGIFTRYPGGILSSAIGMLEMFVGLLKQLRRIAGESAGKFESEGFTRFFAMITQELDDAYFSVVENHLHDLKFRDGVLLSAELGPGNEGTHYVLRKPNQSGRSWMKRVFSKKAPVYSFSIPRRDDSGARALGKLKDRGINLAANALAQSADHIDCFFNMLRVELAFYIGCLNLYGQLARIQAPITFPVPAASGERRHHFTGLYDVCLALTLQKSVVGNAINADDKDLVIITGANQGGKSTFLRSIGLAQLMMQCGMFVPAESFGANVCSGFFTHYRREEDASMQSGKLDEELGRMNEIASRITLDSIVLFNESFAATNEREGSEIARQIVSALVEKGIKVFFVTHFYEFAHGFFEQGRPNIMFLRAERRADGVRTFKLTPGEPLPTSYGEDLYRTIFEGGRGAACAPGAKSRGYRNMPGV